MTSIAFHNNLALAADVRRQIDNHTSADEIIQGTYWENGKGCFIGCIAHGNDTATVEQMTGFPIMLTKIAENIFEGLPNEIAKGFPQRVINAPQVGADLSLVSWKFLHWLVDDVLREYGTDDVRSGCAAALEVVAAKSRGESVTADAARTAARAARAAAYAATRATYAAADAATYAAAYAADAAYAARVRQADMLIKLLQEAAV